MIWNIIDRRERPFRWKRVNAFIEATSHDNCVNDADEVEPHDDDLDYDQKIGVSVEEAVSWANRQSLPVTLYLYDDGKGL